MKTFALSAGHQAGVDNGAVYKDLKEADLTIRITNRASEIIRKHQQGCLTVPDSLDLVQTIAWINARASQIDLCLEVHINSGGGKGVEVWDYAGGPNESDKLARFVVDALAVESGLQNRGTKDELTNRHGRLGFVHDTIPVAVLAECGFIDGDYDFLKSANGVEKLARGIARGVLSYAGVKWDPALLAPSVPTPPPTPTPTPTPPVPPSNGPIKDQIKALADQIKVKADQL